MDTSFRVLIRNGFKNDMRESKKREIRERETERERERERRERERERELERGLRE